MSWKGFTKAVGRLPAMISKQTGGIQETKDEEFLQMENVFKLLDQYARKLSTDSKSFKDSLVQMLAHQTSLAQVFSAIYEPILSVSCFFDDSRPKNNNNILFRQFVILKRQ
jgi:amphiphysin